MYILPYPIAIHRQALAVSSRLLRTCALGPCDGDAELDVVVLSRTEKESGCLCIDAAGQLLSYYYGIAE
jgi:hypothetical protein